GQGDQANPGKAQAEGFLEQRIDGRKQRLNRVVEQMAKAQGKQNAQRGILPGTDGGTCRRGFIRGYALADEDFSFQEKQKSPATFSGAGLKKTGFKLFSFALPPGPPCVDGVEALPNDSGQQAIRRREASGGAARGKTAGRLQDHAMAH
ncbi:MAG: hypothetical protein KGL37_02790, partial [Acidobacteriota bacterium]|nr:hypothetical protein [Acidobacteriota bacterium]